MSNEIAPTMAVANGDAAGAMDYIEIVSGKKHHLQATTKKMCSSNKLILCLHSQPRGGSIA
jgi:hypothetical protein